MKTIREIRGAESLAAEPAPETQAQNVPSLPDPLNDADCLMLQLLIKERARVTDVISGLVRRALTERNLNVQEWAVSLSDCKSIVPAARPAPEVPPAPVPQPVNS
jgi:hypothetical protein